MKLVLLCCLLFISNEFANVECKRGGSRSSRGKSSSGAPPAYSPPQHGNYGGFGHAQGYPQHGYNQHNPYPGYHPTSNIGAIPPRGADTGHYYNSMAGFNNGPFTPRGYGGYSGMGGYGGYSGMGGFGGMGGGYGGFSPYGMNGLQKKSGFFSGSTIRNVLAGMFIWHVTSSLVGGLFRRPYSMYNYYNLPPEAKQEIKIPSNVLTLCEGNATTLCAGGTTAICTTNNTVLCVATMTQATPCGEEKALCVNATIPCLDKSDPLCSNNTKDQTEATIPVPCFTNLTVDINLLNETGNHGNSDYKYCVTQMAIAGPEYKSCPELKWKQADDFRSVLAGNYTWNLTLPTLIRPYSVYNYHHPTEAPAGEVVMPLDVVVPCPENATKLCTPGVVSVCTTFNEIMCLEIQSKATFCEKYNTTCVTSIIPCLENDPLCANKTEDEDKTTLNLELPCFANITVNSNLPNFDIYSFNGTLPAGTNTSYTYHYHYCVTTLGLPGPESDVCLLDDPKDKKNK